MNSLFQVTLASRHVASVPKILTLATLLFASILSACSDGTSLSGGVAVTDNSNNPDNSPVLGAASTAPQARYSLTFDAVWSAETHPLNFPDNPHFSELVGAVHNEQVRFWEEGQIASVGIQVMAENGGTATLLTEVQRAIDDGVALSVIEGTGIDTSPGATSIEFGVTLDYPQITVTSMLAPSPDWFVGIFNFSLVNEGEFIESATMDLVLYDSGSDDGLRYTSASELSETLTPITPVSSDPQDSPFTNGEPIVGTFTIVRLPE